MLVTISRLTYCSLAQAELNASYAALLHASSIYANFNIHDIASSIILVAGHELLWLDVS